MELYAFFHRKDEEIRSQHCVVEKVLELSEREYARFYQSPLAEYDFIAKHRGAMRQDADGTRHCLLVLGENQEDGILVDAEGYDYARYHAFLPKARQLYLLDQYPTIAKFNQEMAEMAEQYTQKAIIDQQSGMYRILTDELALDKVEAQLLVGMLEDRPEIAYLDDLGDELCIKLNPEYAHEEKELPRLSQEDADVICAKHVLWLHDAGGEQADFSGYDLSGLNLSHRNLNSAIFAGTRMYETNLAQAELCFSDFTEATLFSCDLKGVTAEETCFKKMVADGCTFRGAIFTHSNFSGALIQSCRMEQTDWTNCCTDSTVFHQTPMGQAKMNHVSDKEQDWSQDSGPALSM